MKTEKLYALFKKSAGIATDSRNVRPGEIFFSLKGDNFDGNRFAADALGKGASWAVVDDPLFEAERTILVDDCLSSMQSLASYFRKKLKVPLLAITGSNGKTTTKELIAAILSKRYKVHYTKGNLNNHIGVPLTILSTPPGTELLIIEMGASHPGEIRTLCNIARPGYGIITNISAAHIEGFGSLEGVVKAKTELYDYLGSKGGIALYNEENPLLSKNIYRMVNRAVPFSYPTGSELSLKLLQSELNISLSVKYHHHEYEVITNLFGSHNMENIRAAMATGLFFGVEISDILDEVRNYRPQNNRSQVKVTGNNTVICDSYNANPTSMYSALDSFNSIKAEKKAVILGDMLELGARTEEEHLRLLRLLGEIKAEKIFLVGPVFRKLSSDRGFKSFSDVGALSEFLKIEPIRGYSVLVKGSRGMRLEKIYEQL
jgi:UDP-N-acetylmuramoyl-tripeptide--D-alanyl-D-alanine ligase